MMGARTGVPRIGVLFHVPRGVPLHVPVNRCTNRAVLFDII